MTSGRQPGQKTAAPHSSAGMEPPGQRTRRHRHSWETYPARCGCAGSGPGDVWESGYNIGGGILAHYDGTGWTVQPPFSGGSLQGGGLWAGAKNDVWLALGTGFRHWDGAAWTTVASPSGTKPGPGGGSPASYAWVRGVAAGAGGIHAQPSITNHPAPMTFAGASSQVSATLAWSDPNGCQPSFCFSLCSAPLQCSRSPRCTSVVRDGLLVGSTVLTLGYTAVPAAGAAGIALHVVPVSSPGCQDPIAQIVAGSGALLGAPIAIDQTIAAAPPAASGSIVGTWMATSTTATGAATTTGTTAPMRRTPTSSPSPPRPIRRHVESFFRHTPPRIPSPGQERRSASAEIRRPTSGSEPVPSARIAGVAISCRPCASKQAQRGRPRRITEWVPLAVGSLRTAR